MGRRKIGSGAHSGREPLRVAPPLPIHIWMAAVVECFERVLSRTRKNELLSEVLLANIEFGQARAWREHRPPVGTQRRRAGPQARTIGRAADTIEAMIDRPTLKSGLSRYASPLLSAAQFAHPTEMRTRPTISAAPLETEIERTLSFLRALSRVLTGVHLRKDVTANLRKQGALAKALYELLEGGGRASSSRAFVARLLLVWRSATGTPIGKMTIGNPDSGPGLLLTFLAAAATPIANVPKDRRGTIGVNSLRKYARAAIKSAARFGDEIVDGTAKLIV